MSYPFKSIAHLAYPAVLIVAGLVAYANCYPGVFTLDDEAAILNNPAVKAPSFPVSWTAGSRPLSIASYWLNHKLGGFSVVGFHAVNVAVHLAAGLCLYAILARALPFRRDPAASALLTKAPAQVSGHAAPLHRPTRVLPQTLAFTITLLWLVHPLQTESVTYIVQRAEALAGLMFFGVVYCWLRFAQAEPLRIRAGWAGAAWTLFALGMASKQSVVTAPCVALLLDRLLAPAPLRTFAARSVLWSLPFLPVVAWGIADVLPAKVTVAPAPVAPSNAPAIQAPADPPATAGFSTPDLTPLEYLRSQPGAILLYARLSLVPDELCIDRQWPIARNLADWVPQSLLVVAALVASVWGYARGSWYGFLGLWAFAALAPTSSILPIRDLAVEHRVYVALAPLLALIVELLWRYLPGAVRALGGSPTQAAAGPPIALALFALLLTLRTWQRNQDYHSSEALWSSAVAVAPESIRARGYLARALLENDRAQAAREHSAKAVELAERLLPDSPRRRRTISFLLINVGKSEERLGHLDDAARFYDQAVALASGSALPYAYRADLRLQRGQVEAARTDLIEAARLDPADASIFEQHGTLELLAGRPAAALPLFERARALDPSRTSTLINLGKCLAQLGRMPEAAAILETVVAAGEATPDVLIDLAIIAIQTGRLDTAQDRLNSALRLAPNDPDVRARVQQIVELFRNRSGG